MQRQVTQLLRVISFFTACFFSLSAFAAQVAPQSNDVGKVNQTLRLYYLTLTQENPDSRLIERTVEVLSNVLSYRVDVHPVNLDEMHAAYSARRGDIWISTSGFFWEVHAGGASTIATMATPEAPNPNEAIAGAILVHKDRRDLRNLEDLRGKRAVTTSVQAFMNAQTSLGEIAARGYDPEDFFAEIREIGRPMRGVLEAVANGSADAALVKAGIWESLALAGDPVADSLRVISPRSGDSMRLLHTSGTYPGWTIFAAPKLDPHVARDVSFALYSLSPSLLNSSSLANVDTHNFLRRFLDLRKPPQSVDTQ